MIGIRKLALCSLLLSVMILFMACGQSEQQGDNKSPDSSVTTQAATSNEQNSVKNTDPFGKYDPAIELTTVRTDVTGYKYAEGDSIDNNVVYREYESRLGIKLKNMWISDPSQMAQKSNIMIASGDLPDFFEATPIQFQQLINAGLISDITQAYEEYASEDTKRILNEGGPYALKSATVGGKLMGLPYQTLSKEGAPMLYIREDWVKKLGKEIPKTWKEVEELAIAFARDDPDGNNKNDTTGFAAEKTTIDMWSYMRGFFYTYNAYPREWLVKGEQLEYGGIQPEIKDALLALQRLYKEGAVSREFAAQDTLKANEEVISSKAGMFMGAYWSPLEAPQKTCDAMNQYEGIWKSIPLSTISGQPIKLGHDLGIQGYHVVNKNCKNPEAVVKLMNFWMETFYINTSDEVYYKLCQSKEGNNQTWGLMVAHSYRVWKNVDALYGGIKDVLDNKKKVEEIVPEARDYLKKFESYRQDNDNTLWGWGAIFDPRMDPSIAKVETYRANDSYLLNMFYGAPTKTMTQKWQVLFDKQVQVYNKIIMGASIDEYDKFVKEWKTLGGDQITGEVNEWYSAQK